MAAVSITSPIMHRLRILFLRFYPPPDSFLSILLFRLGPLVVLAPNPEGWIGRLVHFDPFQIGTQSIQFFSCLSSSGIPSKFGRINFGRASGPTLLAAVLIYA